MRFSYRGWLVVLIFALWGGTAYGTVIVTDRYVNNELLLTDTATFSDARLLIDEIYTYRSQNGAGDIGGQTYSFSQPASNITLTSSDPASLAITSFTSTSSLASWQLASIDGADQTTTLHFERVPSGSVIATGVAGGYNVLTIGRNPSSSGNLDTFVVYLAMPGDWSTAGTDTGDHEVLGINNLWTIDQDFFFDGTNTIFSAHLDSYMGGQGQELGLRFRLIGSAVPLSGTAYLLALALMILGGHVLRRSTVFRAAAGAMKWREQSRVPLVMLSY